jgi:uncharacterized membrane protein
MKNACTGALAVAAICVVPFQALSIEEVHDLGSVQGGTFTKARAVITKRCITCHSSEKIDAALTSGKDMGAIQREMELKGARLDASEREVLGIYWRQNPLKHKK